MWFECTKIRLERAEHHGAQDTSVRRMQIVSHPLTQVWTAYFESFSCRVHTNASRAKDICDTACTFVLENAPQGRADIFMQNMFVMLVECSFVEQLTKGCDMRHKEADSAQVRRQNVELNASYPAEIDL